MEVVVNEPVDRDVRPPTYGYSAHVEKVNCKELRDWQNSFDYLCVVGVKLNIYENSQVNNELILETCSTNEAEEDIYIVDGNMEMP